MQAGVLTSSDLPSPSGVSAPPSLRLLSGRFLKGKLLAVIDDGFLRGTEVGNRAIDLMTAGVYRNFDLAVEWKIAPGGNSGVKYMVGTQTKNCLSRSRVSQAWSGSATSSCAGWLTFSRAFRRPEKQARSRRHRVSGLRQRRRLKRVKSLSVEQSSAPCSMASAAG